MGADRPSVHAVCMRGHMLIQNCTKILHMLNHMKKRHYAIRSDSGMRSQAAERATTFHPVFTKACFCPLFPVVCLAGGGGGVWTGKDVMLHQGGEVSF